MIGVEYDPLIWLIHKNQLSLVVCPWQNDHCPQIMTVPDWTTDQ